MKVRIKTRQMKSKMLLRAIAETVAISNGTNEDTVTVKDDNIATGDTVAEVGTENPELAKIIPVQGGPNPVEET